MMKRPLTLLAAIVSMLALGAAFAAGDAAREIMTAGVHAQLAASVKDVKMVHEHLHHAVNCLVGPKGKLFDSKAMDPCQGMGNGALNDLGDSPKVRATLKQALEMAERGIHESGFAKAHSAAVDVEKLLKQAGASK